MATKRNKRPRAWVKYRATNPRGVYVADLIVRGKTVRQAEQNGRRLMRQRRNIFAGFRDDEGIFHPIRASADYSARRAGEKVRTSAKRKAKSKKRR